MDKHDEFLKRVAEDILEVPGATVNADTPLTNWDSICMLHGLIILDEVYGVSADVEKIKAARTVGDLLAMVPK